MATKKVKNNTTKIEMLVDKTKKASLNFGDSILEIKVNIDDLSCVISLYKDNKKYNLNGNLMED